MANLYEIAAFDATWAPKFGSMIRINRNDSITQYTVDFAHLPKSTETDFGVNISTNKGRTVQGAIWICDNNWSLADDPDFVSDNYINTDDLPIATSIDALNWHSCTFTFTTGPINATKVILGVYTRNSSEEETRTSAICYRKSYGTTLYYMRDLLSWNPSLQLQNTNGLYDIGNRVQIDPYYEYEEPEHGNKPLLKIANIKYRTLSIYPSSDTDPNEDHNPAPTLDMNNIIKSSSSSVSSTSVSDKQWNTVYAPHPYSYTQGFDFAQGCLKDVTLFGRLDSDIADDEGEPNWSTNTTPNFTDRIDYNNITDYNDTAHPYWTHARSRIRFTFDAWVPNGRGSSKIKYTITGADKDSKTTEFSEKSGKLNTLLICPKDEGISDNSSWSIQFIRYTYDAQGRKIAESVPLVFQFYTFVTPEVKIAHPKPLRNKTMNADGSYSWSNESYNYVLWANDVLNDQGTESRETGNQICDALNLLLSKDGGDNSGYPMFTRVYIQEYEGYYDKSGDGYVFNRPSNDDIKNNASSAKVLANWTGVFLDDGNLIQLSGVASDGYTWDWVYEEDANNFNNDAFPLNAYSQNGPVNKPPYHAAWVESTEDANGNSFTADDNNPALYELNGKVYCKGYAIDKRMCFRAGRKYLIRVRRFHSTVVGAMQAAYYKQKEPWMYKNYPIGGGYDYEHGLASYIRTPYWDTPGSSDTGFYTDCGYYPICAELSEVTNSDIQQWLQNGLHRQYVYHHTGVDDEGNRWEYYSPESWVGAYDGAGAATLYEETKINEVYPGYSKVDYVILDCLNVIYTNKDIVSIRPAVSEINANRWITFAYRHLAKNMTGIDSSSYEESQTKKLSGTLLPDGTPSPNTVRTKSWGLTWGGNDNTAHRIYHMYEYLIKYILHILSIPEENALNWEHERTMKDCKAAHSSEVPPDDDIVRESYELRHKFLRIYLDKGDYNADFPDHPMQKQKFRMKTEGNAFVFYSELNELEGEELQKAEEDNWDLYQKILLYEDTDFDISTGAYKTDCLRTFMTSKAEWLDEKPDGLQIFYDKYGYGSDSLEGSKKYPPYGNTYRWVPIINATNTNGNVLLPIKHKFDINSNRNGWSQLPDYENVPLSVANWVMDTTHGVNETNTLQPYLSNNTNKFEDGEGFTEFTSPVKEYSAYRSNPQAGFEGKRMTELFATRGSGTVSELTIGDKYGSSAGNKTPPDESGIQYFNTDGVQLSTGELYKRIPLSQDCENGIPTEHRLVTPLSKIKYPLVRTTHMLYFKTYILGNIKFNLMYAGIYNCDYKVVVGIDDEGNEIIEIRHLTIYETAEEENDQHNLTDIGKTITFSNGKSYTNILEVYGEDNGGAGRLLSGDNDTTAWYTESAEAKSIHDSVTGGTLDGGIEIPIKVRYTPLVQPIMTQDETILGKPANELTLDNTSNIIKVVNTINNCTDKDLVVREYLSQSIQDELKFKTKFYLNISYGMYYSSKGGRYVTLQVNDDGSGRKDYHALQQSGVYVGSDYLTTFPNRQQKLGANSYNYHNVVSPYNNSTTCTDVYPAVGICNCYLVLLIPSDAADDYGNAIDFTNQVPNWFADRANYENITSKNNPIAKTVIVADLAFNSGESVLDSGYDPYDAEYMQNNPEAENYTSEQINHQYRTIYSCEFNYKRLLNSLDLNPDSGWKDSDVIYEKSGDARTRKNKLVKGTWYDLVIVPVYSNHAQYDYKFKDNDVEITGKGEATTFDYTDGAGTILNDSNANNPYGGGESDVATNDQESYVDYYGSTPLVVRKFLKIDSIEDKMDTVIDENGEEENCPIIPPPIIPPDPEEDEDLYNWTLPAIIYPNVNNYKFSSDGDVIQECPGFWLNNTFRVIIRGPHFRCQSQIDAQFADDKEISVESATDGELQGLEGSRNFKPSDFQIHIGRPDEIKNIVNDNGETISVKFTSKEFTQEINKHSMDVVWLNSHQIYSMRFNTDAFSKCAPINKQDNDDRDVVLGGDLKPDGVRYSDRFFEFNPNIVGATTPYPEGYYIQVRWLNNEYSDTSSGNEWSTWYSGLLNDYSPDTKLGYCVPVRNYNDIYTTFRSFIKESYPGSAITSKVENVTEAGTPTEEISDIIGQGTQSPRTNKGTYPPKGILYSPGNAENTPVVPASNVPSVMTNTEDSNVVTDSITNTDFPYFPQIWEELSGKRYANKYETRFPELVGNDKVRQYWEMCYVDYIIRNMVKLYYSDWQGAYIRKEGAPTAADFGWTQSLADYYQDKDITENWEIGIVNTGHVNHTGVKREITSDPNFKDDDPNLTDKNPGNRNRYFRKPIMKEDFDQLTDTLKRLVEFIRDERFTGKHTDENDPKGPNGKGDGTGVLLTHPDNLDFERTVGAIIGSSNEQKLGGKWSYPIDTNYIRILMDNIINKIIFYLD